MPKVRQPEALTRLGQRLRARRLFLQLPLRYAAEQMKLSESVLLEYERGRGHPPALTLSRMAKVLGTDTSDLLGERRKKNREDIERAIALFAEPQIFEVANLMSRLAPNARAPIVLTTRAQFA
jgi:transcriptional regulator with XRE-family HTH domain